MDPFKSKLPFSNIFKDTPDYVTVCVKHKDGKITEHPNIDNSYLYIREVLKNPNVETAWVKRLK